MASCEGAVAQEQKVTQLRTWCEIFGFADWEWALRNKSGIRSLDDLMIKCGGLEDIEKMLVKGEIEFTMGMLCECVSEEMTCVCFVKCYRTI